MIGEISMRVISRVCFYNASVRRPKVKIRLLFLPSEVVSSLQGLMWSNLQNNDYHVYFEVPSLVK